MRNEQMDKGIHAYKPLLLIVTISLAVYIIYDQYGSNQNSESKNITETSYLRSSGENNTKKIAEITSILSELKSTIDRISEDMADDRIINDDRIGTLELAIKIMAENNGELSNEIADQPVAQPVETPQYSQDMAQEKSRERAFTQMGIFENALIEEDRDETWAIEMEDTLTRVSNNEKYFGTNFYSPICKSTFCKLDAHHSDIESRDNFENIRREIPNSYHIQHYEEAGEMRSVLYIIRQGEEENNIIFRTLNERS
jgi:hypothetical protein